MPVNLYQGERKIHHMNWNEGCEETHQAGWGTGPGGGRVLSLDRLSG